jgi:hypothetical protein
MWGVFLTVVLLRRPPSPSIQTSKGGIIRSKGEQEEVKAYILLGPCRLEGGRGRGPRGRSCRVVGLPLYAVLVEEEEEAEYME